MTIKMAISETDLNKFGYSYLRKKDFCVMCERPAVVIALKTNEPLCEYCMYQNDEAREKQ